MTPAAVMKVTGRPAVCAVALVSRVNQLRDFVGRITPPLSSIQSPRSGV
jgi:hypothetical protein